MFLLGTCAADINFLFMKAGQKLKKAIDDSPYTQADFARLMDVEPQAVRNWINRGIPARDSFKAGRILGKNPEWLALDDKDLPKELSQDSLDQLAYAEGLWELLDEEQQELIGRLIQQIVAK